MRAFGRFNARLTFRNIVSIVMHAFESVTKTISQLSDYITLSRATYSILLLLIIALLLKSLIATWQSGKITVGEFDYFADGVKKADFGEQIRAETFEFYNLIVKLIQQEAERTRMENGLSNQKNKEEEDKSERLPAIRNEQLADLNSKSGELQQLEITVQGINIKNLFSSLGAFVTPSSRELKASIFSSNNTRRVFVTAPSINNRKEARPVPAFISGGVESDTATAFRIACYMIWSQWDAASLDSDFGVNLSEFCRVARLLYIRTNFDALPSYEFQKLKFKDEVEFLKETYQLAALAGPDYGLIYSSLRGLERYFGDEKVNLTPTTTATIDSLVDLVGFFSLQTGQTRDPRGHWTDGLPPDVTERKVIDRAYFAQQISNDCDAPDPIVKRRNIPDSVRSQFDNVVRILSKQDNQTVVRTGLIISDEVVITVGNYGHSQELETLPDGTEIQIVSCGKIIETHKMKSVGPVSATGKSPYLRLVVPGLKAKAPTPSFPTDDDKPWAHDQLYAVGYLQRSDGLFRDRSERRQTELDNNDRRVFRAQQIPYWTSVGEDDDDAERFDLDIPVAAGLIGSPVFSSSGQLVGLLDIGQYPSRTASMILGVGVSAKPLFDSSATKPVPAN